jgi:hypothetical protein
VAGDEGDGNAEAPAGGGSARPGPVVRVDAGQPSGSMTDRPPARTCVAAVTGSSRWGRWCRRGRWGPGSLLRRRGGVSSSAWGIPQPSGSQPPRPAAGTFVVVCMGSAVRVDACAAAGACVGGDVHRRLPSWWWLLQPLSSMRGPAPARMVERGFISRSPGQGSSSGPRWRAVRVDAGAVAGRDARPGLHLPPLPSSGG